MNATLDQLRAIDAQLDTLRKMLERGEYLAAGVEITVKVGANKDRGPDVTFSLGIASDLEALVRNMHTALQDSRAFWLKDAHEQLIALRHYINESAK